MRWIRHLILLEAPLKPRGNPAEAFKAAPVKIEAEYTIPIEHHNPMEPHGAIAFWEDDKLTIFDKTQGVNVVRQHLAASFNIPHENVQVISPFVGGAFGSSLRPNYYPALAAMAAREIKRPVKMVYTRTQMFTGHGYRPHTWQKVSLGAERNGKLTAIIHEAVNNASTFEDWTEDTTDFTRPIYACPNADTPNRIVKTDLSTPASMRAPGAVSGMFALECAMDELAYALKMDPLELRLVNYTEVIRTAENRIRAKLCVNVTGSARKNSAGKTANSSRARCGTEDCWSAGAWRPESGARFSDRHR